MRVASRVAAYASRWRGGFIAPNRGGGVSPVTFPGTILRIRVELLLGGVWTDISPYVLYEQGITIDRGRTPAQRRAQVSKCVLKLRNETRAFSPRNVTGPHFGKLRRNTPLRVFVNPGSGDSMRFTGRVPRWAPVLRGASNDRILTITAYGRRNQMERGEENLESAQYRYLSNAGALQYRPMEGSGEGTVTGPPGSGDLPDLAQGGVWSDFPGGGPPDSWRVEADAKFGLEKGQVTSGAVLRWNTGGTVGEWRLGADSTEAVFSYTVQATGVQTTLGMGTDVYDGLWHHWQVDADQNGANVDITVRMDGAAIFTTSIAQTLGSVGFWLVQDDAPGAGAERLPAVGHVAVYGPIPADTTSAYDAFAGWAGETPVQRFIRLTGEIGIPSTVRELVADGELMGPQGRTTVTTLLDECEATCEGVIDEDPANLLRLSSRTALWNQAVALALDYTAMPSHIQPPLTPSDDDELTRNRWAISRDGSDDPAAVAELLTGPLNINEPEDDPLGIGPVKDANTLSLYTAEQAQRHASYRVARDTIDDPRFPQVKVSLGNAPTLIPGWLGCDTGSRVTIANPPSDLGVDAPDTILAGYTEFFNQVSWTVDAFLDAGAIHRQAVYSAAPSTEATAARYDCNGSTLATALSAATGAGSVDVMITDTCAWAHDTGDYGIMINAEEMTVTAVAAVSGTYPARTQTLTVVRAANGVQADHAVGAEIHVRYQGRYAL